MYYTKQKLRIGIDTEICIRVNVNQSELKQNRFSILFFENRLTINPNQMYNPNETESNIQPESKFQSESI